jgi:tetratricopeptide (TPR) repeat protein
MLRAVLVLWSAAYAAYAQNSSPQELFQRGMAAQQAGEYDRAVRDYRALVVQYPNVFEIRSNLGASLAGEGHYSEAIAEYQRALALKSNPRVRLNLALAYYKTGDIQKATETLERVHQEAQDDQQAITLLADCYLRLGKNKQVITLLAPYEQSQPDNRPFIYLLGTALVRDGQTDKGQVIIDKILRDGDSAESRLLMGTAKYMVADFSGARDDFAKAVQLNPKLPDAFAWYGMALLSTGDQAGAKKAFEKELAGDPNNFVANLHLGAQLRQDQDYPAALKYLQHALELRTGDPAVRFQIASVKMSQNRLPEAEHELEALVNDSPQFIEAHVALATLYFRQKRKADGERERAIFAKLNAERQAQNEVAAKPAQ